MRKEYTQSTFTIREIFFGLINWDAFELNALNELNELNEPINFKCKGLDTELKKAARKTLL